MNQFKGLARDRIRQIEANAVRKLQQLARSQELVGFLDKFGYFEKDVPSPTGGERNAPELSPRDRSVRVQLAFSYSLI